MAMLNNQMVIDAICLNIILVIFGGESWYIQVGMDHFSRVKSQEPYNGGITFTACPPGKRRKNTK